MQHASTLAPAQSGLPRAAPSATGLGGLLRAEIGNAFGPRHLAVLIVFPVFSVLLSLWMPTFPQPVYDFFVGIFRLEGWADIVMVNVITGIFFILYVFGVFDVLRIYVVPYEERYLEILFAKPLRRSTYMAARLIPIIGLLTLTGALSTAAALGTMQVMGLDANYAALAGACAVTIGLAVAMIALVNFILLGTRDTYTGLAVGFLPMLAFWIPGGAFMYRPDFFDANPIMRDLVVFPLNLLWRADVMQQSWLPITAGLFAVALTLAWLAGWRLEQRDVT